MRDTFKLKIMAPDNLLFEGDVVSISVNTKNGWLSVLAHHAPMFAALDIGSIDIKTPDNTLTAYHSEGLLEVTKNEVRIFTEACEFAEDIDTARAELSRKKAEERLRQKQSLA